MKIRYLSRPQRRCTILRRRFPARSGGAITAPFPVNYATGGGIEPVMRRFAVVTFVLIATAVVGAADWPQWRGPNRDNQSTETGLYRTWPAGGPEGALEDDRRRRLRRRGHQGRRGCTSTTTTSRRRSTSSAPSRWPTARTSGGGATPVDIRPNHGITRTVPSVSDEARLLARPEVPVPRARREDRQAGLAEEPGAGVQGDDPRLVRRAEPAARRRPRRARDRRRRAGRRLRPGDRQGSLAVAEPRQGRDVARAR